MLRRSSICTGGWREPSGRARFKPCARNCAIASARSRTRRSDCSSCPSSARSAPRRDWRRFSSGAMRRGSRFGGAPTRALRGRPPPPARGRSGRGGGGPGPPPRGRDMDDSALVLQANWPNVAQLRWEHYHGQLIAVRARLTPDQTDSAYRAGAVRLFQHILVSVPPSAAPKLEQDKKHQAEGLLRQVEARHGTNFSQVAQRYSEDPGSKSRGGYLGAVGRGRFVPAFDSVAWRLDPGAMSGLVRSPFGFHIIRRPPLEEVRGTFRTELEPALAVRFDSAYIDNVAPL